MQKENYCPDFVSATCSNILRPSTQRILAVNFFSLYQLNARNVKHVYLSPVTSYMFRCLLHHLHGDRYVIRSRTVCFLHFCYTGCAIKCKIYPVYFVLDTMFQNNTYFVLLYLQDSKCQLSPYCSTKPFKACRLLYVPPALKLKKFCMLFTLHLCVLCVCQKKQYVCLIRLQQIGFCNRNGECLLRGTQ